MVDKYPGLIARCSGKDDVVACVNFARDHELLVSVRGGGHNYAGKAVCDGGLMIDLSPMKGVLVDRERRTVRAQAGLRLGELDRETQQFGLATTLGVNTDTGIAGLTLGGGYGWLAGKYGLSCDNLIAAEVVTADGTVIEANAEQHDDLFWSLRGAGANFGVVTTFEYKLHPVETVLGGLIIYPLSAEILRFFDEFSMGAPDEVTTIGAVLTAPDGNPAFGVIVCYCGPPSKGEDVLKPLRSFSQPLADMIEPRSYLDMQAVLDEVWLPGRHYYNKAHNIRSLNDDAIRIVLEYGNAMPTPVSNIVFQQLHGAASRVGSSETAFPHRYDHYALYVHPATDDPTESKKIIRWARECWEALKPFVEQALYVNALEDENVPILWAQLERSQVCSVRLFSAARVLVHHCKCTVGQAKIWIDSQGTLSVLLGKLRSFLSCCIIGKLESLFEVLSISVSLERIRASKIRIKLNGPI